ncbi:NAD(P)/FAD-dependent oxidoreductase [Micromonospora sp. NPDC049799]|uniref:NAD(P)/FAD-dependent oxidoreductase n=1 Tax=Micromonospora sp. NPDC049799 TaxID=3154741 RepID=UPI0033EA797C
MYDVIIIGAGAAGLSAAQVLGRQQRRTLLLDGGPPRNHPADGVHMLLGRDGHPPLQLLADGRRELAAHPAVEVRQARVDSVAGTADAFTVILQDGSVEQARRLLLATGQVDQPWPVPGVPQRWGRGVFHCPFCHGWEARGKSLGVLGRDPAQVMLAAYLADRYSDDVVVATHGPHTLPQPVLDNLTKLRIRLVETPLDELAGEPGALELRFTDGTVLTRQAVFHRAPTVQGAPFAAQLGAELLPDGYVRVDEFSRTTVPGVYAAGDLARQAALPDGLTLVSQAVADGVRAAVWIEQGLFREALPVPLG